MQLSGPSVATLVACNEPSRTHNSSHVAVGKDEDALPHKWKGKRNNVGGN